MWLPEEDTLAWRKWVAEKYPGANYEGGSFNSPDVIAKIYEWQSLGKPRAFSEIAAQQQQAPTPAPAQASAPTPAPAQASAPTSSARFEPGQPWPEVDAWKKWVSEKYPGLQYESGSFGDPDVIAKIREWESLGKPKAFTEQAAQPTTFTTPTGEVVYTPETKTWEHIEAEPQRAMREQVEAIRAQMLQELGLPTAERQAAYQKSIYDPAELAYTQSMFGRGLGGGTQHAYGLSELARQTATQSMLESDQYRLNRLLGLEGLLSPYQQYGLQQSQLGGGLQQQGWQQAYTPWAQQQQLGMDWMANMQAQEQAKKGSQQAGKYSALSPLLYGLGGGIPGLFAGAAASAATGAGGVGSGWGQQYGLNPMKLSL